VQQVREEDLAARHGDDQRVFLDRAHDRVGDLVWRDAARGVELVHLRVFAIEVAAHGRRGDDVRVDDSGADRREADAAA
jgi:hypothetical protein